MYQHTHTNMILCRYKYIPMTIFFFIKKVIFFWTQIPIILLVLAEKYIVKTDIIKYYILPKSIVLKLSSQKYYYIYFQEVIRQSIPPLKFRWVGLNP